MGGVNLLMGLFVLGNVLFVTPHPLISRIVFTEAELAQLAPKTTAVIRSLAVLLNASVVAGAVLVLVVGWIGRVRADVDFGRWRDSGTQQLTTVSGRGCIVLCPRNSQHCVAGS